MKDFPINFLKKKKRLILHLIVLACLFFLVGFAILDVVLRYYLFDRKIREFPIKISSSQYPVFKTPIAPDISAKAAIVMDSESKVILFSKNPGLLFSMASTTKIMTALVALDYYKMSDILTVKTENVEGVNVGFKVGEKLNFLDVLYSMLLPSGNDSALVLSQNYPGGELEFVKKMNEKAFQLHLDNTNFADSIGLEDSRDYTTPLDLARLSSYAMEKRTFREIVATKTKVISDLKGENTYLLNNLNKLLGVNGVNGIKTGYTDEAGQVLVTSKIQVDNEGKEHTLIIVVMNSKDRFWDTSRLLDSISGNINYLSIHP